MYAKVCEAADCGTPFRTKWAPQKHCSRACANRHRTQPGQGVYVLREFACAAPPCGKPFTSRNPAARYCSRDCQTDWGRWSYRVAHHANKRRFDYVSD